ncbi:lysylphosphatidylglycerol synthase transmembrane domain-containing protein [Ectothiorhodospira lacustris]|uniref:lysylphosphatidylglycerol synthase transmembrane domain-containing protein n=1 Tax=Ectothiorhodospira lacustris TaxID=2899127 RepID=UPI001EE8CB12|nr:lysylphosphatidylglycerol synthase transmembrane domain-containing protein [Ectothiorhodospira lacustris]MCG5501655.1 flippase-like domain-containing protein [Ectothiorhodospira lacustris]MCG5509906.1 flippase-like domain-containing protein [Ectothiorhodospira lacustris]MCG5521160.1 flippase-like domain-containing protein [Ectothiorhodospira lacustris]
MSASPVDRLSHLFEKRRLWVFTALFALFTLAGAGLVYLHFDDTPVQLDPRLFSPRTLAFCALLLLLYFVADGLRLYFTVRALGYRPGLGCMTRLVFVNLFVSNITPLATGGGFVQVLYLQQAGMPLGTATAATTIRTTLAMVMIFAAVPLVLMAVPAVADKVAWSASLALSLGVFIALYLGFLWVCIFHTGLLVRPLDALLGLLAANGLIQPARQRRRHYRMRRELIRLRHGFRGFLAGGHRFPMLAVLSTLAFLVVLFSFPAILLHGLGYEVGYLQVLAIQVVTTFISYFAPTPGASGIAEGSFGHFFSGLVTGGHLLLVVLAWRFLTIYLGMVVGLIILHRDLLHLFRKDFQPRAPT